MGRTIGYMRMSTGEQDGEGQRTAILEWSAKTGTRIDEWVSETASSRKAKAEREVSGLIESLQPGDTVVSSELSRFARSMIELFSIVGLVRERGARIVLAREDRVISADESVEENAWLFAISIGAQIERQMISERTKAALAARKASGVKLGRPKGPGKSKLDPHREKIVELLGYGVPKAAVARQLGVAVTTLHTYIKLRALGTETDSTTGEG